MQPPPVISFLCLVNITEINQFYCLWWNKLKLATSHWQYLASNMASAGKLSVDWFRRVSVAAINDSGFCGGRTAIVVQWKKAAMWALKKECRAVKIMHQCKDSSSFSDQLTVWFPRKSKQKSHKEIWLTYACSVCTSYCSLAPIFISCCCFQSSVQECLFKLFMCKVHAADTEMGMCSLRIKAVYLISLATFILKVNVYWF